MSVSYRIEWDNMQRILSRRGLEDNGRVQFFVSNEVAKRSDKYVPLRSGMLKNTVQIKPKVVTYVQPYAARQYYRTATTRSYDPLRGAYWFERMKNAEGKEILRAAARMAGGKT
jgi:hypothetical protein